MKKKSCLIFVYKPIGVVLFVVVFLVLCCSNHSFAQDLEQIGKKDPLKVNGALSLTNIFYTADGIVSRRPPSMWFFSGNVNFDLYGWSVPLSMSISQQNRSFNQPFNQYGLSPKYKWITLHAGYRSLTFSPYTLAGHTFLGGGIELAPKNYKFAAMYGRMLKAVAEDTLSDDIRPPSFQRMGWGWKAGYEKDGTGVDISMFHAKDDLGSIPYVPEKNDVVPAENLVIGIAGKTKVTKQFSVQGEYANSAYTRDIRSEKSTINRSMYANLGNLFIYRTSTSNYGAYKASGTYAFEKMTLGATIERIQPGYRSLGTYFFNNDMQNITFNSTARVLKDKMNIGLNLGTQRNNLQKTETNTIKRIIGSINISYTFSQKLNMTLSYSNFQTITAIAQRIQQFQNIDSLRFYQVSQSANGGLNYNTGNKERKHGIGLNMAYQVAKNTQSASTAPNNDSKFFNANISYRYTIVPKNVGISIGINGNQSQLSGLETFTLGPTASVNRTLFKKKFRSSVNLSYSNVYNNGINNSRVLNLSFNNNLVVWKRNTFSLNGIIMNREARTQTAAKYSEYTCTVGYTFVF